MKPVSLLILAVSGTPSSIIEKSAGIKPGFLAGNLLSDRNKRIISFFIASSGKIPSRAARKFKDLQGRDINVP
jgi:hypothetical protein